MPQATKEMYIALNCAHEFFNKELFENKLGDVIITLSRKKSAGGFFSRNRWTNENEERHEISLNPDYMRVYGTPEENIKEVLSTLLHEMCHQWQEELGKPREEPRKTPYHDKEWAKKMIQVGLIPSHNGKPKGKMTGVKMSHYIAEGGKFEEIFKKLPPEAKLPFLGIHRGLSHSPKTSVKYSCEKCNYSVRGKGGLSIICGKCGQDLGGSI